jgi:hypothetical protein
MAVAWHAVGRVPGALPREVQVLRRILSREQVLVLMLRGCGRGENERMYRARLRGCPRFAVLAGGLALILAGCGTATAPPPGSGSGHLLTSAGSGSLPPSGGSVVYVLDPPRITPVDLAHHRTGRPVVIPDSLAAGLVAVTPDHRRAYVLTGTSLVPVSLITGPAGRPLTVPQDSSQVDYLSTDGRTAYLVAGTTITPVDLRTDSAGRPLVLPPLSSNSLVNLLVAAAAPVACLTGITASGPQNYVIECVNLATGTTGKPITVPGAGDSDALAPDGRSAYIASDSLLVPVNLVTGSTGRPIHTPIHIGAVAVTPDGRTAYVGNLKPYHPGDGVIIPIDLAKGTAHAAISVPSYPYSITDIVISRDGRTAYAAAYSSVIPIDIATGKPAKPIPMPSGVSAVILTA